MLKGLLWIMLAPALLWHPVHVSVTHVGYDASVRRFRISIRVFRDDFESLIALKYGTWPGRNEGNELTGNEPVVKAYFEESLDIVVNNRQKLRLVPAGFRENEESVWFLYESQVFRNIRQLHITNRILLELFEDQTNLLILTCGGTEKGLRFDFRDTEATISLD